MNGKGSARRPRQVSRHEYERNWEAVFGVKSGAKDTIGEVNANPKHLDALVYPAGTVDGCLSNLAPVLR